jgi:hypothetical protein
MENTERATRENCEGIAWSYRVLNPVASEFSNKHGRTMMTALRFGEECGPEMIAPMNLQDDSSREGSREKVRKLSSWIHKNSNISAGCAGALVAYMQSREYNGKGGSEEGPQIQCIEIISMKDVM